MGPRLDVIMEPAARASGGERGSRISEPAAAGVEIEGDRVVPDAGAAGVHCDFREGENYGAGQAPCPLAGGSRPSSRPIPLEP